MTVWEGILLGLLQGLTEFLPISSSGHLVLGEHLLGIHAEDITFEVFVHFGTTLSVLTYFRRELAELIRSAIRWTQNPVAGPEREAVRWIGYLALSAVPAACVGLAFEEQVERLFSSPLLWLVRFRRRPGGPLSAWKALLIGLAQAVAITPGISRSGATVAMALYLGVEREEAARFSFLMLLPVVMGATLLKALRIGSEPISWAPIFLGTGVAYLSGLVAIHTLLVVLRRGRLEWFALYCYLVGLIGLWKL